MLLLLDFTLIICTFSALFLLAVCILLVFFKPRGIIFLGQLVPEEYFYFPVAMIVFMYHSFIMIAVCGSGIILGNGALAYCFYITIVTRELQLGRKTYHSLDILRTSWETAHVYRRMQIVHRHVIAVIGPFLVVLNAFMMMSPIYVNFVVMRYWDILEPLTKVALFGISLTFVTFYITLLELGCTFYIGGIKMLRSWQGFKWSESRIVNLEMKRFQRSCKPITLCWGNHFIIGKHSIFIYGRGVVRGTFRALLTIKK